VLCHPERTSYAAMSLAPLALRMALAWTLPGILAVVGLPVGQPVWFLSLVLSLAESAFWMCNRDKGLKKYASHLRRVPFPLRLSSLLVIQLCIVVLWSSPAELSLEPAVASHARAAGALRRPEPPQSGGAAVGGEAAVASRAEAAVAVSGKLPETLGRDLDGRPFDVDADISTLSWSPKSISVVLPCAEEREYAFKTVKSVFESTPADVLQEIIVVDDGSEPPLSSTHLTPEVQKRYNTRVERHEKTVGLIGAKKTGGDAALGDIVVFFDCHVAPQPNWHAAFLRLIGENYRRLVVPQITALNVDTWTQVGRGGGMAKCYLTWDADFKWFDSDDQYAAVISGGLLGMSRRWWRETGGYDEHMMGWGGENLDQSLRIWLCGGEIVTTKDSFVAHMWRVGTDSRTSARYKHVGDVSVNRARAVYAWYGDFAEKLLHYPTFAQRSRGGQKWYGDLSNILSVKDRLKCRPFSWFLRRFKSLYEDAGLIPKEVFMIRERKTGMCLRFSGAAGTSGNGFGNAQLHACSDEEDHRLFWHMGNKGKGGKCCSGLRAWNTDQCLEDVDGARTFKTAVCDVSGRNAMQHWAVNAAGQFERAGNCVVPSDDGYLQRRPCPAVQRSGHHWIKHEAVEPLETQLYHKARRDQPGMFRALDAQMSGESADPCAKLPGGCLVIQHQKTLQCLDEQAEFTQDESSCGLFYHEGGMLHSAMDGSQCLDKWSDDDPDTWGFYICHGGISQQFILDDGRACCGTDCVSFKKADHATV